MNKDNYIDINEISQQALEIAQASVAGNPIDDIKGSGVALIKSFSTGLTKHGKSKYTGILMNKSEVRFNVWYGSAAFKTLEALPPSTTMFAVKVNYTVTIYGLVLDSIEPLNDYDPDDFTVKKYDPDDQMAFFEEVLSKCNASEKAKEAIEIILHLGTDDEINNRFIKEYAAMVHHDNCDGGLFAHTTKCLSIYAKVKSMYEFLEDERMNDLMTISIALHDVGKIFEMNSGVYQAFSFITHRGLGLEYFIRYKEMIIDLYDEEFFYMVCSAILQHHGEYGENPRTVCAELVHKIDEMEATLTGIEELLENNITIIDASGKKIKFNDSYLNVLQSSIC